MTVGETQLVIQWQITKLVKYDIEKKTHTQWMYLPQQMLKPQGAKEEVLQASLLATIWYYYTINFECYIYIPKIKIRKALYGFTNTLKLIL